MNDWHLLIVDGSGVKVTVDGVVFFVGLLLGYWLWRSK